MGFRYQDLAGQQQTAADIRALQLALKQGLLAPDSMVLDESVNVRLKAAALIAFKAREKMNAAASGSSTGAGADGSAAASAPAPSFKNPEPSYRQDVKGKSAGKSSRSGMLVVLGAVAILAVLGALAVNYMNQRSERLEAARKDMKSMAQTARDLAKEIEKDLPEADKKDAKSPAPVVKASASTKDMLAQVLPMLRQSQQASVQNGQRHKQEVEQLGMDQVLSPEVLLSREGIARNNLRIKSFRASLDRLSSEETARMQKIITDVNALLSGYDNGKAFARGFEEGLGRSRKNQDEFLRTQYELADLFQRITDFMAARQGSAQVRGNSMLFSNDSDVAAYQQYMKDLDRLAKEEEASQRKIAEAMKQSARQMDEWSK